MTAQNLEQHTYLPEQEDAALVLNFLEAREAARGTRPAPRYLLIGVDENDSIELPRSFHAVLRQVVEAMKAGKAVTVAPQNQTLTTQQAADLLGVSRPTVVKLIDDGKLPAETPGTRRRLVKLDDVLKLRDLRRQEQYRAILATSPDYDDLDDVDVIADELRRVRAEIASERAKKQA